MNVNVANFFEQIDNIIQNYKYSDGDKAYAITSKWYNAFAIAAKTKDNNFSKKIINDITDSNWRIDPRLTPKYDYVIVPQKAWNKIKNTYKFSKEVEIPVFYNSELSEYVPCIHPKEISIYYSQTFATLILSEENTIKQVLEQSKKCFNINNNNYHLYNFSLKNFPTLLSNEEQKLKDLTSNYSIDLLLSEKPYHVFLAVVSRGICGLENVGQTCYINAIIQCLSHCKLITDYFLSNDINKYMNGKEEYVKLTQEFIKILKMMINNRNSFIPMKEFKESLSNANHAFKDTTQQDAGEFFTSLLSMISAAIMRPKDQREPIGDKELPDKAKEIVEKEIDNSFLGDIFYGLLNNKTTCPKCNHVTENYASFSLLPLRLPSSGLKMEVVFYSIGMKKKEIYYLQKQPGKDFTVKSLLKDLKSSFNFPDLDRYQLVGIKELSDRNRKYHQYELITQSNLPREKLNNRDFIYIYDVSNIELKYNITIAEIDGLDPIVLFYDPNQIMENSRDLPPNVQESIKNQLKTILGVENVTIPNFSKLNKIIIKIYPNIYPTDQDLSNFKHEEMALTLENCLKLYSTTVLLDDKNLWDCPNCCRQVQATRNSFIYQSPKILAFYLSRWGFSIQKNAYEKDTREVTFPDTIELSKFMISNTKKRNYELFGVVNHGGSMSGGHYTAGVKIDGTAYLFNDKIVTECQLSDLHSANAYILFYKLVD